jgi:hypothetical protein
LQSPDYRGSGSGFLVTFRVSPARGTISGLLTNNHVIDRSIILGRLPVCLIFERSNLGVEIPLDFEGSRFCFTGEVLDCTFLELHPDELHFPAPVEFLDIDTTNFAQKPVFVIQHMPGREFRFAQGSANCNSGIDLAHKVNTLEGSSGSAICSPAGN